MTLVESLRLEARSCTIPLTAVRFTAAADEIERLTCEEQRLRRLITAYVYAYQLGLGRHEAINFSEMERIARESAE